jgi:hypothetical protein
VDFIPQRDRSAGKRAFEFVQPRHDHLVGEKRKAADAESALLVGRLEYRATQQLERLPQRAEVLLALGGERNAASERRAERASRSRT